MTALIRTWQSEITLSSQARFSAQARVGMHIAPAVGQEPGATTHALGGEAGLLGHPARRRVVYRVFEVEPVKPASNAQDAIALTARGATPLPRAAGTVQ